MLPDFGSEQPLPCRLGKNKHEGAQQLDFQVDLVARDAYPHASSRHGFGPAHERATGCKVRQRTVTPPG